MIQANELKAKEKDKNKQRLDIEHSVPPHGSLGAVAWRVMQRHSQKPEKLVPRHGHQIAA